MVTIRSKFYSFIISSISVIQTGRVGCVCYKAKAKRKKKSGITKQAPGKERKEDNGKSNRFPFLTEQRLSGV